MEWKHLTDKLNVTEPHLLTRLLRALAATICLSAALGLSPAAKSESPKASAREELRLTYVRPAAIPYPSENGYSKEKELLGRTLFFDPRLSGSGWISCATCHNPGMGWSDGLPKALGHGMKVLDRHTPTILNIAWADLMFWDGRAESLEEQALGPIAAPGEMNQDLKEMVTLLQCIPGYRDLFAAAFSNPKIDTREVAQAIATFERTVVSGPAPFDSWIAGSEDAISQHAKAGFDLFNGKAGCGKCHSGWNFTDNGFHDIGVAGDDPGRGRYIPVESQKSAFKTPGLRNIDRLGPYMHDGSTATLAQVIEFYDRGGDARRPGLAPEIQPLHLTADDKYALLAFLGTLTGQDKEIRIPQLPR